MRSVVKIAAIVVRKGFAHIASEAEEHLEHLSMKQMLHHHIYGRRRYENRFHPALYLECLHSSTEEQQFCHCSVHNECASLHYEQYSLGFSELRHGFWDIWCQRTLVVLQLNPVEDFLSLTKSQSTEQDHLRGETTKRDGHPSYVLQSYV